MKQLLLILFSTVFSFSVHASQLCSAIFSSPSGKTAYEQFQELRIHRSETLYSNKNEPYQTFSYGTSEPILRSFESEGLWYSDIYPWFPKISESGITKLKKVFATPSGKAKIALDKFLLKAKPITAVEDWDKLNLQERLNYWLSQEDPISFFEIDYINNLFFDNILEYQDLDQTTAPEKEFVVVSDADKYEIHLNDGVSDRTKLFQLRQKAEDFMEGKVGHQHLMHFWPTSESKRQAIRFKYIETLDSTSWYLFWRQMKRDETKAVGKVLFHPYLGVYTRSSLERLDRAMLTGDEKSFNDKFRMVGARRFKANEQQIKNGHEFIMSWELRSGNKGIKSNFVEDSVESRLVTGDYSGIKDYNDYDFDLGKTNQELLSPYYSEKEMKVFLDFAKKYPFLAFSASKKSFNHFRNKILSPLFSWENRLNISHKLKIYKNAQKRYADSLLNIAEFYLDELKKTKTSYDVRMLRIETKEKISTAIIEFADKVRLDYDFERYLTPAPKRFPEIKVSYDTSLPYAINPNEIPLGVEYSFRFPLEKRPQSRTDAREKIMDFATALSNIIGNNSTPQEVSSDYHGHGISEKYNVQDKLGQIWRVEWDGIQRDYDDEGVVTNAYHGHIEVASPKFIPESIEGNIQRLYETAHGLAMQPSRHAGGAHMNFDLSFLKSFPEEVATRKIANLIALFEQNQNTILFLWTHPMRYFATTPVTPKEGFFNALNEFRGGWNDFAQLLYSNRYFNTLEGRKPKYVPLNLTSLLDAAIPDVFKNAHVDIKNPDRKWVPDFNLTNLRGEARFFDAPKDLYFAGLQIKYWRAFLNTAFNSPDKIIFSQKMQHPDTYYINNPDIWVKDIVQHLQSLGLDPKEFEPLIWDSYIQRREFEKYEPTHLYDHPENVDHLLEEEPVEKNKN